MSTLCAPELAASQFALLTSLVALPGSMLAMSSGYVIDALGYEQFFEGTALLGVPVALLALYVWHRDARMGRRAMPAGEPLSTPSA